ncbi:type I polyketide synthase, partial [Herpetosiphon giganteus]|uniref:type I polyketide synthase n=1 Tax=Herpetosiphon giganteus TaxID=2029754 RepID=UPI0019597059
MIDNQPSDDLSPLSPIKRAFLAIEELQAKLRATERAQHAPIAIIGMACRFPGGANSPAVFWQQLLAGFDAMQPVPADRWNNAEVYAPTAEPGKVYTNQAAFIDNIRGFDAQFFGISPREAAAIDPQQRILLELAWEALEDAGVIPANLVGSSTGVFIGSMTYDYLQLQLSTHDLAYLNPQIVTGSGLSFAAGRISYLLGLQGPSLVVDTACSSSLLSTHLAVQSLRSGECNLALAGGVNAILTPQMSVMMSQLGALSADSHCKTFDADADGYARGEGCGILILKRLDQALADNDHIYAVIQGTATNHDGASAGLTVPNGPAQQTLMRKALADAALAPEAIQYIEAHGTGTSLGDPIELGAIAAVYAKHRTADTPLLVGSVKTNIGHLEGAAGISGLIKLILALYHGKIPSHRHFTNPNPYIDWDQIAVRVQTSTTEWSSEPAQPRVGAVSSFGLSGTNVHMIVAAAEPVATPVATHATSPTVILLSAHTHAALHARWTTWQHWLPTQAPAALPAIAATAAFQRTHFSVRTALVIDQPDQVAAALAAPPVLATVHPAPRVAFVFAGQAPLDPERFAALAAHPVTAPILAQGFALLQQAGLDLPALLALPDAAQHLRHTQIAQPALLLMQVALTALWRTLGIQPAAVLGHSVGELAAAVAAGVLAFPAALALAIARGTLLAPLHDQGAMLVVGAAAATVAAD